MSSSINVLHLSTHNEECGIAIFQENIVTAMGEEKAINNVFFDLSPNKLKRLNRAELTDAINRLLIQLEDFDILHVQHEYSFYNHDQLQRIVDGAKAKGKKVLFTLHTPPHALKEHGASLMPGLHPRSWIAAARNRRRHNLLLKSHIRPLMKADMLLVPSNSAVESFAWYGVPRQRMQIIELPVPEADKSQKSGEIASNLNKQKGDIILSTTGFIAKTKGIIPLVKSLTFLPDNYKLAIIGGSHPSGVNDAFYDKVCDSIRDLGLVDRVYITGYVKDDARRDALLRETDICVYAYDKAYYDYVSSAALTNAIANELPIVAYRTRTFEESNEVVPFINFCDSANYYELARTIKTLDMQTSKARTADYAKVFTVKKQAARFAEVYLQLVKR